MSSSVLEDINMDLILTTITLMKTVNWSVETLGHEQ